jgi:hypothetical protein
MLALSGIILLGAVSALLVLALVIFCLEYKCCGGDREDIQYIKMLKKEEFNNN